MNLYHSVLRKVIAPVLVGLRAHRLFRIDRNRDVILMFHGVTAQPGLTVRHLAVPEFVKLLELLDREFAIVSLEELHSKPPSPGERPRAALTFDDGYLNNFTEACVILEKKKLPATFFLITGSLENADMTLPVDVIDCIIEKYAPPQIRLDQTSFFPVGGAYYSETRENIFEYILRHSDRMHEFSAQLSVQFPHDFINDPYYSTRVRFIDRTTLTKLASNPLFEFSSHTRMHVNCESFNNAELLKEEFVQAKKIIEEITQKPCVRIAYPYGRYTKATRTLTTQSGYTHAYSVTYQLPEDFSDRTIFQRIGISNTTTAAGNLINIFRLHRKLALNPTSYQNQPR